MIALLTVTGLRGIFRHRGFRFRRFRSGTESGSASGCFLANEAVMLSCGIVGGLSVTAAVNRHPGRRVRREYTSLLPITRMC